MNGSTVFDYYGDESSQFSFYRIPRQLITGHHFKKVSTDAKLLSTKNKDQEYSFSSDTYAGFSALRILRIL